MTPDLSLSLDQSPDTIKLEDDPLTLRQVVPELGSITSERSFGHDARGRPKYPQHRPEKHRRWQCHSLLADVVKLVS